MLEILGLEICFVILIHRLEKEQTLCSAGGFHDDFFISGFPVLDGIAIWVFLLTSRANEPCPFQHFKGLGSCPEASTSIRPSRRATWVP